MFFKHQPRLPFRHFSVFSMCGAYSQLYFAPIAINSFSIAFLFSFCLPRYSCAGRNRTYVFPVCKWNKECLLSVSHYMTTAHNVLPLNYRAIMVLRPKGTSGISANVDFLAYFSLTAMQPTSWAADLIKYFRTLASACCDTTLATGQCQ